MGYDKGRQQEPMEDTQWSKLEHCGDNLDNVVLNYRPD